MNVLTLFLLFLVSNIACNDDTLDKQFPPQLKNTISANTDNIIDGVRFDFKANYLNAFKETIEVRASLYNDNSDTVYFLTSSCDGMQYSLQYDTSKLILTPFLNCNASFPTIEKISSKGHFEFKAHFIYRKKESNINLGFDFYKVDKSFDLNKIKLNNIHNRPGKDKNIKWADRAIE